MNLILLSNASRILFTAETTAAETTAQETTAAAEGSTSTFPWIGVIIGVIGLYLLVKTVISMVKKTPSGIQAEFYTEESVQKYALPHGILMIVIAIGVMLEGLALSNLIKDDVWSKVLEFGSLGIALAAAIADFLISKKMLVVDPEKAADYEKKQAEARGMVGASGGTLRSHADISHLDKEDGEATPSSESAPKSAEDLLNQHEEEIKDSAADAEEAVHEAVRTESETEVDE